MKGLVLFGCKAQGLVVVAELVLVDLLVLVLSLLDEESDAFLAMRAAIIAGQPASDTTTGRAINQHPIFTNLIIISSPYCFTATSNNLTLSRP